MQALCAPVPMEASGWPLLPGIHGPGASRTWTHLRPTTCLDCSHAIDAARVQLLCRQPDVDQRLRARPDDLVCPPVNVGQCRFNSCPDMLRNLSSSKLQPAALHVVGLRVRRPLHRPALRSRRAGRLLACLDHSPPRRRVVAWRRGARGVARRNRLVVHRGRGDLLLLLRRAHKNLI